MNQEEGRGSSANINYLFITIAVIIIDQFTKFFISIKFNSDGYKLIGNILNITIVRNTGALFGTLQGHNLLLIILSIIIIITVGYYFIVSRDKILNISLALILGGAIGNLIDRIRLGYVFDFIDLGFWPVFNFADSSVSVGAIILFLYILKRGDKIVNL